MAIMDSNGDSDILRVWEVLSEVSEQLAQNRNTSIGLHSLVGGVKVSSLATSARVVLARQRIVFCAKRRRLMVRRDVDSGCAFADGFCVEKVRLGLCLWWSMSFEGGSCLRN
jgi:hypothetical protein